MAFDPFTAIDDLTVPILYACALLVAGILAHLTIKSFIGEWSTTITIVFGSLLYFCRNKYLKPSVREVNFSVRENKNTLERLKESVKDTKLMLHMGSDVGREVYEYDADGRKIVSGVGEGLLAKRGKGKKLGDDMEEELKDHTTVELRNGRLLNSKTSHLKSAMDWHENELVAPRRRMHKKMLYTGKRKGKGKKGGDTSGGEQR